MTYPPLDITAQWGRLNDGIIRLVDYIPDEKLNWSPKPELWNFKGTLIHVCGVRHGWVSGARSGDPQWQEIIRQAQTREGIQKRLQLSWDLVAGFLANPEELAATYDNDDGKVTGHWIAYHLLEHEHSPSGRCLPLSGAPRHRTSGSWNAMTYPPLDITSIWERVNDLVMLSEAKHLALIDHNARYVYLEERLT